MWRRLVREGKVDTGKLRVIWETPHYVDYVWAAGTQVSETRRARFRDAFLRLDPSKPDDREVLGIQDATRFVPARPGDFDHIEQVGLSTGLLRD